MQKVHQKKNVKLENNQNISKLSPLSDPDPDSLLVKHSVGGFNFEMVSLYIAFKSSRRVKEVKWLKGVCCVPGS